MTKKHFEAIAAVLNANRADIATVLDMADMCAKENPSFNRSKFVAAATWNRVIELDRELKQINREIGWS